MGLFSKIFGQGVDKTALMRRLLRRRISQDPSAAAYGQSPAYADAMPLVTLLGLPEATIVTCVESWAGFLKKGVAEAEITQIVTSFRRAGIAGSSMQLAIHSIVKAEHGHSGYLPKEHIDWCIREAKQAYGIA